MGDELYYLDCAEHLAFGYVDHPPFSIAVLAVLRALFGDSLLALHALPALLHVATIALIGALARELGGGRVAQGLAGLGALVCPIYLADAGFYSMNAFEPALWALVALLLARIANGAAPRTWLWLGVVLGVGLLNKWSVLWLGLGLGVALVSTPERRWLATRWPWLCAGIALALFSPHVAWQVQNDWPTLEFMRNATAHKMTAKSPLAFAAEQVLVMNPVAAPLWLAGAAWLLAAPGGRKFRTLGWTWLVVLALLAASGSARSNYSGPAYAALFAAGGVAWEGVARRRGLRFAPAALALVLALGLAAAPLALPLVPPESYAAYTRALGIEAPKDEVAEFGPLPIHLASRIGWSGVAAAVAGAYDALPPEERGRVAILGGSFGETGALNFFGAPSGLPRAISAHNNYWLWGPGAADGSVVIALARSEEVLLRYFERVERAGEIDCRYCMPAIDRLSVYVCRGPRRPLREVWSELKHYI